MTLGAWIGAELSRSGVGWMIGGGIVLGIAEIAMRLACGSPYRMILELGIGDVVPPVWLMTFLRFLSFVTVGCAAGLVLGWRERGRDGEKYKGCLWFLGMAVLELCWYPTIFTAGMTFLGSLEAVAFLCLGVAATVIFFRVSRFSGFLMLLHDVWLVYLMVLTFSIFFRN